MDKIAVALQIDDRKSYSKRLALALSRHTFVIYLSLYRSVWSYSSEYLKMNIATAYVISE